MITDLHVKRKYGADSEGSIFWKEWADKNGVKFIQDIYLTIPDSKPWQH
jgi:hypothetical protein